tara:strand:+ start:684 stop:1229 length:546 start_codon:yes stop_codon:yes gene_type:complete
MWIQKKIRDALLEMTETKMHNVQRELAEEYPQFFKGGAFDPSLGRIESTTQGSNQYGVRGKVNLEISNEAFNDFESGSTAKPFSGTFTQKVKAHKRELGKPKGRVKKVISKMKRTKPNTVRVKKHTRIYKNMKPVKLSTGEWRILTGVPAIKGNHVVGKKVKKLLVREAEIAAWIQQYLKL